MPLITVLLGVLLTILGGAFYGALVAMNGSASITALIPAFFGVPLICLGGLAMNEKYLKHSMHAAAAIALLGGFATLFMVLKTLLKGGEINTTAVSEQAIMAVMCLGFVMLCGKSFFAARNNKADAG